MISSKSMPVVLASVARHVWLPGEVTSPGREPSFSSKIKAGPVVTKLRPAAAASITAPADLSEFSVRTYVRTENSDRSAGAVIEAAAAGRSFVTTGPALIFELNDGSRPGDVTSPGSQTWRATLASTTGIDLLEIIVNGSVVEQLEGVNAGETRTFTGQVDLPVGGWIAARAYAAEQKEDSWPTMHARPYAHSSPIWIGEVGSSEPGARAEAAADLIRAIDAAEIRARQAYGDVEMKRMMARFDEARTKLRGMTE